MKILLCGARGFIGSHLLQALRQAGHEVICGVSQAGSRAHDAVQVDYARDTQAAAWRDRVEGMDVVINAVGVLRDTHRRPIQAVHADTPIALFEACAQAEVRHVVHISALGIEHSATRYAQTKLAAEQHLRGMAQAGRLSATILKPSIVFGKGGDSSALFLNLARLPIALMPGPVIDAQVQPVAVTDLADVVVRLVANLTQAPETLACVGPQSVQLGDFIASLRTQLGHRPATVLRLPEWVTSLSARCGDLVSTSPWSSEAVDLLRQPNVADAGPIAALLGRPTTHFSELLARTWQ